MHVTHHSQRVAQAQTFAARRDSRVVVVRAAAASVDQTIVIGLAADSGPTPGSGAAKCRHPSTSLARASTMSCAKLAKSVQSGWVSTEGDRLASNAQGAASRRSCDG